MQQRRGVRSVVTGRAFPIVVSILAGVVVMSRVIRPHLWRIRVYAAHVFSRVPQGVLPRPLRVMPPPQAEFVGVWEKQPAIVRRNLTDDHGFTQLFRAYLHAYRRGDRFVYEVASLAYRPDGITGKWQLHVRLFPAGAGRTDVWAHWERNPNVAPLAHLKREGYDPERGRRELLAVVDDIAWADADWEP